MLIDKVRYLPISPFGVEMKFVHHGSEKGLNMLPFIFASVREK